MGVINGNTKNVTEKLSFKRNFSVSNNNFTHGRVISICISLFHKDIAEPTGQAVIRRKTPLFPIRLSVILNKLV